METETRPNSLKPENKPTDPERVGIKCRFSQINDLTTTIDFKDSNLDSYNDKFESKKSKNQKGFNCECFMTDTGVEVISKGGSKFNLPLEQKIEKVFPLEEGLLVEFHVKHELKLQDLLAMAKLSKEKEEYINLNENEENFFSYITLNRHPLNPLKLLGGFSRKNTEKIFKWYRVPEKICYVSKKLPFLISYNFTLHRHAFHYIRLNHDEKVRETNTIQFQNYFFTLHNLHNNLNENPELLLQSTLSTDMFFEETNKENILSKCKIVKGADISEIFIYMLIHDNTSYVKIYSVDLLNQNYDNQIAVKSVKKVSVVNEVRNMFSMNFFQPYSTYPEVFDIKKKLYKPLFEKIPHLKVLTKAVKTLKDNILLCDHNGGFSLFHHSQCLVSYQISIPPSLQNFLMRNTKYLPPLDVLNFKNEQATLALDGTTFKFTVAPKIRHFLVSLVLKTLAHFFEESFYEKLFSDVVLNCLNFDINDDRICLKAEEPDGTSEQFNRFVYYFVFMLKLCNKNGPNEEEIPANDERPSKKLKKTSEDEIESPAMDIQAGNANSFGLKSESLRTAKNINEQNTSTISTANWNNLCKSKFHISNAKRFDQLFQKKVPIKSSLAGSTPINLLSNDPSTATADKKDEKLTLPKVTLTQDLFYHNRVKIFRILHLLYQEMKISKLHHKETLDLAYFLYCYAKYMNHHLGNIYCDYYLRENFNVLERYRSDFRLLKMDEMIQNRNDSNRSQSNNRDNNNLSQALYTNTDQSKELEKEPPELLKWIQTKLFLYQKDNKSAPWESPKVSMMPIIFKLSHQICNIFEILTDPNRYSRSPKTAMNEENTNIIETENLGDKKAEKRSFIFSEIFARTSAPAVASLGTDVEKINRFEQEFPFFHYNIIDDQYNGEDGKFNYKQLKKNARTKEERIFLYLIKKKMSLPKLNQFCFGISTPILEVLRAMRQEIPRLLYQNLPKLAFKLIKRDDLYKNLKIYHAEEKRSTQEGVSTLHGLSNTINNLIRGSNKTPVETFILNSDNQNKTKTNPDHAFLEANRLLDTSKPMRIKKKYFENVTEDRIEAESQAILMKLCMRRFSVVIGQGALNFVTVPTLITEVLKIPKINLSAISPVSNNKITLEFKDEKEQVLINWPEFHNGVANGLKLFKEIMQCDKHHLRIWIFYQRPETPKFEYGGFLLAMGLLGFLDSFMPTDIYQYLKPGHEATSVGILLGLAASRIGKMDEHTSKTLCLHIPYLLPPSYDIEIPLNVQTTAIVGLGLLHLGTSNRIMTEITLAQIGRKPLSDKGLDRDGYSLAAGYALGLINLCKGTSNPIIKDLDLDERLIRFVEGGKPIEPPKSILYSNYNHDFNKCSSVREGNFVNTHITCPAALLALSLIYLKSNKADIADRITVPNSFSDIEFANPNNILMKIVARNLIMWNKIENTTESIYSQIPSLIRFIFERPIKEVQDKYSLVYNIEEIDFNTVSLIYCNIIGGCIMSMGLRYAGTGDQKACETIIREIEKFKRLKLIKSELVNDVSNKNAIDNYNLSTLLCVSVLAMSLIMAGTCDITCLKWCRIVRKRIEDTYNTHFGFNMAVHMAIGFLFLGNGSHSFTRSDLSIASLLISIYPHFPTTSTDNKYHLQALRHFYVLATERRMFYTVDIETNKVVNLRIQLELENNNSANTIENHETPVLIQDSKKCVSLKVLDEEYYNVEIKFKNKTLPKEKVLYVRKKYPKEVNVQFYKPLATGMLESDLNLETFKEIKKSLGNDIHLSLAEFLSRSKIPKNKKELLLFVFPFNQRKIGKLVSEEEINYIQDHYKLISTHEDSIYKALTNANKNHENASNLVGVYLELLREDRADLLPLYLSLLYFNENPTQIDSLFLQNLNIILKFYENRSLLSSIGSPESEVFNSIELEKVRSKVCSIFNSHDEIANSPLFNAYLEKLDINNALKLTERNYELASKMMKYLVLTTMPSLYDLGVIKACIQNFNSSKKDSGAGRPQESQNKVLTEQDKKILTLCELYLFLSFPLCPREVLTQIALHYIG